MTNKDIAQVVEIEKALFASPWDEDGFDFEIVCPQKQQYCPMSSIFTS